LYFIFLVFANAVKIEENHKKRKELLVIIQSNSF